MPLRAFAAAASSPGRAFARHYQGSTHPPGLTARQSEHPSGCRNGSTSVGQRSVLAQALGRGIPVQLIPSLSFTYHRKRNSGRLIPLNTEPTVIRSRISAMRTAITTADTGTGNRHRPRYSVHGRRWVPALRANEAATPLRIIHRPQRSCVIRAGSFSARHAIVKSILSRFARRPCVARRRESYEGDA